MIVEDKCIHLFIQYWIHPQHRPEWWKLAMIETELSSCGKCCRVAWHECFGKMSKMIDQESVEVYMKYIELELNILIEECNAIAIVKNMDF